MQKVVKKDKAVLHKKGIIDRFEGDFTLIELDNGMFQVSTKELPEGAKEGDILIQDDAGNWQLQQTETDERRKNISNLMDSLFEEN